MPGRDREAAVRWAEEVIASGITFDEISIPKPEKKTAGTSEPEPKGKRVPKEKGKAKKTTKKTRR